MPVGWALVNHENTEEARKRFANVHSLKNLALQEGQPWAERVKFTVNTPLSGEFWTEPPEKPREWKAVVEIDGVDKKQLKPIFEFIHKKCSHVDGIG